VNVGNVLVLYDSKTGNTAKMADYVAQGAEEVEGTEVRLLSVDEASADDVFWCDGLAVGSPTYVGVVSWRMKRFWDEVVPKAWGKVDGKIACAFSSSGGWGGGAELTCLSLYILLMNFGFLVFGVPDYVGEAFTLHHGAVVAREPKREEEIAACRRLGKRLAQWVAVYVDGREEHRPGPIKQR
jgi:NAD(P)H dehydrogenase (quinone)